eukprot:SAG31_NODE_3825_length_3848_cov_1.551614_1_plen_121_part_00
MLGHAGVHQRISLLYCASLLYWQTRLIEVEKMPAENVHMGKGTAAKSQCRETCERGWPDGAHQRGDLADPVGRSVSATDHCLGFHGEVQVIKLLGHPGLSLAAVCNSAASETIGRRDARS